MITDGQPVKEKIKRCWAYVAKRLRYQQFVKARVQVDGKTFVKSDVWLDPGAVIQAGIGNCMNRSTLLCSLLRNILPPDRIWVVLGNVKGDGHAWVLARLDKDYILETTSPHLSACFIPAMSAEPYDPVVFFNDRYTKYFPQKKINEPFSKCYCVAWLESYLQKTACDAYI
jgi:hypothetical protein